MSRQASEPPVICAPTRSAPRNFLMRFGMDLKSARGAINLGGKQNAKAIGQESTMTEIRTITAGSADMLRCPNIELAFGRQSAANGGDIKPTAPARTAIPQLAAKSER